MRRWKSWEFGKLARALPVARDPSGWLSDNRETVQAQIREIATTARRNPSSSPPETLEAILAAPDSHFVKKRREWDIHKYARLYTGETYPIGPSYDICLRNCWLHVPSGTVVTADKEVLAFSSYALNCFYEGHSECDWDDAPWVEGPHFKLATVWGRNFAHWLMDALPKADALGANDLRTVVLDKDAPSFQAASLDLLAHHQRIVPASNLLRFRELHFVSTTRSGVPDPRPLNRVKIRLQDGAGKAAGGRRIYISRQKTRRRILNGDEVGRVLVDFGFEEVFSEELSLAEQIRAFSGAEVLFGAHGAGTLNVLFMAPGGVLIEAFNPKVWDHAAHRVASLFGIRHFHLFAENANDEYDVRLDLRTLERTLSLALDKVESPRPVLVEERF